MTLGESRLKELTYFLEITLVVVNKQVCLKQASEILRGVISQRVIIETAKVFTRGKIASTLSET